MHLARSLGFAHVGTLREVGLKFDRRLDVEVMQLMLNSAGTLPESVAAKGTDST
jgi:L-amino acid N-acyltransferase YncA